MHAPILPEIARKRKEKQYTLYDIILYFTYNTIALQIM